MNAFVPTASDFAQWWLFAGLLLGIVAVLLATYWVSEHVIDGTIARWHHRRKAVVIDFEERRRINAVMALRDDR